MPEVWPTARAAPTAPTTFHATLPPALTLPGDRALALTGGGMSLRVSPGNGMAIGAAGAANAGLMAAGILAVSDPALAERLDAWRQALSDSIPQEPKDD